MPASFVAPVRLVFFYLGLLAYLSRPVLADFVAIAPVIQSEAVAIASELKDTKVVVCVRQAGKSPWTWAVHEAVGLELAIALNEAGVDAVRSAWDYRTETLSDSRVDFKASDARQIKPLERNRLLAGVLSTDGRPHLRLTLWSDQGIRLPWTRRIEIPQGALQIDPNVPELNRRMVAFIREKFDQQVGTGECAELASVGLRECMADKPGVYTWGRELDPREQILPGDVLQLELVKLESGAFKRNFPHHTAVVEDVRYGTLVVLHQNVGEKGKIVQRDTWPLNSLKSGALAAFRPWSGTSPLKPVLPRRRLDPQIVREGKTINLLRTVDPRMDAVRGIWFFQDGRLLWNRDTYARLQVPVTPPESYSLRIRAQRLFGVDQLGIGLVVGGQQTLLLVDAYGGRISGLHLLDGKYANNNESTYRKPVFVEDQTVDLHVQVRPRAVTLTAGREEIMDWSGDPSRLSQDARYLMPRTDWLYLASWNTQFAVSEFRLIEESAGLSDANAGAK